MLCFRRNAALEKDIRRAHMEMKLLSQTEEKVKIDY